MTDSIGEILKGVRCYFDKALPMMLLYKKERKQYHEVVIDNVSPSTIYGAEHLLRLFGMFVNNKCQVFLTSIGISGQFIKPCVRMSLYICLMKIGAASLDYYYFFLGLALLLSLE